MILKFFFHNAFSFKNAQELSLRSRAMNERLFDDTHNKVLLPSGEEALLSAVLYGANGGGKSNFVKACGYFSSYVLTGGKNFVTQNIPIPYFKLDDSKAKAPITFEVEVYWKEVFFRYGFILSQDGIIEEWLFVKKAREVEVFRREKQKFFIPSKYTILNELVKKDMIHRKAFLVTIGAQFNDSMCALFVDWVRNMKVLSGNSENSYRELTIQRMKHDAAFSEKMLALIKYADFGVEQVSIRSSSDQATRSNISNSVSIFSEPSSMDELLSHRFVTTEKGVRELRTFVFGIFESEGTQKFAHIAGPIIEVLEKGGVLVIDELDTKLHPDLTERLVLMFHNKKVNPKHAQLIFTSHNTNLLNSRIFRRDQIFFVEKDAFGASDIYSLANIKNNGKGVRNDEDIQLNYSKGKYGAVPFLGDFDNFLGR